ncbi:hypothetical protein EV281_11028 [Rhizobium sp. BK418]|nr:hypothetical protein EV281_11028 [Rhizobium sp. BK418]
MDLGDVCLDKGEIMGVVLVWSISIKGKIEVGRGQVPKRRQRSWDIFPPSTPFCHSSALCSHAKLCHLVSLPIKNVAYHGEA